MSFAYLFLPKVQTMWSSHKIQGYNTVLVSKLSKVAELLKCALTYCQNYDNMSHDVTCGVRNNPLRVVSLVSAGHLCYLQTCFQKSKCLWDVSPKIVRYRWLFSCETTGSEPSFSTHLCITNFKRFTLHASFHCYELLVGRTKIQEKLQKPSVQWLWLYFRIA